MVEFLRSCTTVCSAAMPYHGLQVAALGTRTSHCLALFGLRQQENFVNTVQAVHSRSELLKVLYKISLSSRPVASRCQSQRISLKGLLGGLCHTSRQQIPATWAAAQEITARPLQNCAIPPLSLEREYPMNYLNHSA